MVLTGKFGIDMEFHYCTKDAHAISGTQHWPVGNYCILRQGISCPSGIAWYIYSEAYKFIARNIVLVLTINIVKTW